MRMRTAWLPGLLCVLTLGVPAATESPAPCDRACLEGLLDRYVEALVARHPSRFPTAGAVTFTENGQRLELGDGLWHTVTGKPACSFTSPASTTAAFSSSIPSAGLHSRSRSSTTRPATRAVAWADGRKAVSGPSVPWTWQVAEVFKIERGKIGPIESVLHQVPYGMGSGWSTWEDAMASRPRWSLQP